MDVYHHHRNHWSPGSVNQSIEIEIKNQEVSKNLLTSFILGGQRSIQDSGLIVLFFFANGSQARLGQFDQSRDR